ncbi:aspartyl/glutamyl-tRNA(Asn/Gln) amidotransferase subunit C [Trichlorobacter thiogenes]|jgi:aspartyl-tRNA(Asn)/glutamyl-tRNA(Gln) amidotransferase subunit C|uniref:Aspartyl/glutamyl-tRNA(Asn/Gln) amidotransferase subunit C n=1 Tax=Trichlorobacter thiogenes TaxID=115783 RepID=A0A1T4M294_9BACT|nr:Asp-tRNA(Asn)/Glu-tRNA(Gln) amidotransferase subunit GatC [Trichlorobacter thiogenes]SJZ60898.1 aspartyl/glutamyl-tRNA(Asn/Gln) amidotransferase subunit C [Trichlorobacter thiogenes]
MSINQHEIEHVAKLARLSLRDDEKQLFTGQMEAILAYVETLNELNTDGISPTSHAVPMENAFRPDCVTPSIGHDRALANAPDKNETYFRVPPVIE